jgi:uncharacterized protein YdeI (YjbR/CyaY-like superfamily)
MKPRFFSTPADFRKWLAENHDRKQEQWVGFHKKECGKPSITWPESVDVALCFGWIDGLRKSVNETSYMIRFTPRKSTSTWSAINIKRVGELKKLELMHPAGLKAFADRDERKSATYSYEQRTKAQLGEAYEAQFRANKKAWEFFQAQPPWYRRTSTYWVISAKREETRRKRLETLIKDSAAQRPIRELQRKK